MQIRVIAPFRCHFGLRDSQTAYHEKGYSAFADSLQNWFSPERVRKTYAGIESVYVHHQTPDEPDLQFWSMKESGATPLPNVLTVRPDVSGFLGSSTSQWCDEMSRAECQDAPLKLATDSVVFEVFDNTVAFVEFVLDFDDDWCFASPRGSFAAITHCTNTVAQRLVASYYQEGLLPILLDVARRDSSGRFVDPPGEYDCFPEMALTKGSVLSGRADRAPEDSPAGKVMWVNRSAYVDGLAPDACAAWLDEWVPLSGAEELRSELHTPGGIFIGWGHSSFRLPLDHEDSVAALSAIRLAQYFYTVLHVTNLNLSKFIGQSLSPLAGQELRQLQRRMKAVAPSVDLFVATYVDTQQTVQGASRNYFLTAGSRYSTDDIVVNIERKTRTVNDLIQRAFERMTRRTQTMIELLVFALGGLALVDLTLNLTAVAHSGRDEDGVGTHAADGVPGLLDVGASIPADALIWFSSGLLAVFLVIYLILHGRRA